MRTRDENADNEFTIPMSTADKYLADDASSSDDSLAKNVREDHVLSKK